MKNYEEAKKGYIDAHLAKDLKQPGRRLNALEAIERNILQAVFTGMSYEQMLAQYEKWKAAPLSSAEKSVIKGLYEIE